MKRALIDRVFWPVVCSALLFISATLFIMAQKQSQMLSAAYYLLSQQQTQIDVLKKKDDSLKWLEKYNTCQKKLNDEIYQRKMFELHRDYDRRDAQGRPVK